MVPPPDVSYIPGKTLQGYDVVNFTQWELVALFCCSPLSCNGIVEKILLNPHCLFDTLPQARAALLSGAFENSEPGPFRIVAVYTCPSGDSP